MSTYVFAQAIGLNEVLPEYTSADASGNTCDPGDRVFLHLRNNQPASVSASVTVTIVDPNSAEPVGGTTFDPNLSVVIPSQNSAFVGPLYASRFANSTTGYVDITYDDTTSVDLAVLSLNPPSTPPST